MSYNVCVVDEIGCECKLVVDGKVAVFPWTVGGDDKRKKGSVDLKDDNEPPPKESDRCVHFDKRMITRQGADETFTIF